jgi:hypothetical protein
MIIENIFGIYCGLAHTKRGYYYANGKSREEVLQKLLQLIFS